MKTLFAFAILLLSLSAGAQEVPAPGILTSDMLDSYVRQINSQSPIKGPDTITIVGASRQDKTIIYKVTTGFETTAEAANLLNSLRATKKMLCRQEAEGFLLSRGVGLAWNYFDSQGKFVGTISVSPEEC